MRSRCHPAASERALARFTKNGLPPTARNARTGELTPPGMYRRAEANNSSDLALDITTLNYLAHCSKHAKLLKTRVSSGVDLAAEPTEAI